MLEFIINGNANFSGTQKKHVVAVYPHLWHIKGDAKGDALVDVEAIGLIFPVHMWGVSSLVLNFLKKIN